MIRTKDLIIAKYNEDVSWSFPLQNDFRVYLYDKSPVNIEGGIKLRNIGRESHTYLFHILANWDNLADINIFCQGNPFDHCADFLTEIKDIQVDAESGFYPLYGSDAYENYQQCDLDGNPHHAGLTLDEYIMYAKKPLATKLDFAAGGMFVATREAIKEKGFEFWHSLYRAHYHDVLLPYKLERLWGAIFGY